jgi:cob(I)alamin adenosyltransferase
MIQIYTGNGKGKTTAAIGQAVRAAGNGMKTFFAMFMKNYSYSELKSLEKLSEFIVIKQFANDEFVLEKKLPSDKLKIEVKNALAECEEKMKSGEFDIIVLDEAIVSIYFQILDLEDLIDLLKKKPENIEIILTGRYCPQELIELADLVTEMKEVKHYYQKGILARKGFES